MINKTNRKYKKLMLEKSPKISNHDKDYKKHNVQIAQVKQM